MKKILSFSLKLLFSGGIIYFLIRQGKLDPAAVIRYQQSMPILYQNIFVICTIPFLSALRWQIILGALDVRIPFLEALRLTWVGLFFGTFIPGAVSGDVLKGYYLERRTERGNRRAAVVSLLADRFSGFFGLIILGGLASVVNFVTGEESSLIFQGFGSVLILGLGAILLFYLILFMRWKDNDPIEKLLQALPFKSLSLKLYTGFREFRGEYFALFLALFLSVLNHLAIALTIINAVSLFTETLQTATQMMILPFAMVTTVIPIAPAGVGVGHAAFHSLYNLIGFGHGADVFNLYLALQIPVYLVGALFYLTMQKNKK